MRAPIVLLTDFGDGYFQGVMKGVILARAPGATIVDLDHHITPGGILQAGYVLRSAITYFPPESIFVCVVDPGVGSARRRLLVEHPDGPFVIAPDNGLVTGLLRSWPRCVVRELANPAWFLPEVSATFEGRSRFAPAAAALALGARSADAGVVLTDPVQLDGAECRVSKSAIEGRVVYIDPFGNLVTTIDDASLSAFAAPTAVTVDTGRSFIVGLSRSYSDAEPGALLAYVGSTGHLEIGVRDGHAAERLEASIGTAIIVRKRTGS